MGARRAVLIVLAGEVAAQGTPHDMLDQPATREVAAFLGFTGRARPRRVGAPPAPGPGHAHRGRAAAGAIERRIPEEDGVLCDARLPTGLVQLRAPYPGPQLGDRVQLAIDGGVRFPARTRAAGCGSSPPTSPASDAR